MSEQRKTRNIVRERLGLPDASSLLLHDLTSQQLIALLIAELDEKFEDILNNGCNRGRANTTRIEKLESCKTKAHAWIQGAYAMAGMLAATALFIFACIQFVRALR